MDCNTCFDERDKIQNIAENVYVDGAEFIGCELLYTFPDNTTNKLYAEPICASLGSKIKVGVFADLICNDLQEKYDIEDFLFDENGYQMKLFHHVLKLTYSQDQSMSCLLPLFGDTSVIELNEMCAQMSYIATDCDAQSEICDATTPTDGHDGDDNHDGIHEPESENDEADYIDISGASLGFRSCKTIVEQDAADCVECDKAAQATQSFVTVKLCVGDTSDCSSFREHFVPLEKYLASELDYQKSTDGKFCGLCAECETSETESENARLCDAAVMNDGPRLIVLPAPRCA